VNVYAPIAELVLEQIDALPASTGSPTAFQCLSRRLRTGNEVPLIVALMALASGDVEAMISTVAVEPRVLH